MTEGRFETNGIGTERFGIVMAKSETEKVTKSVTDVLGGLMASLPFVAQKDNKDKKWQISLDTEEQMAFTRWIDAKVVSEPVMQRLENAKDQLNEICLREFVGVFFENRSRPSNPQIVVAKGVVIDHQATWIMTDKFKMRLPDVSDHQDAKTVYVAAFVSAGIHPNDAENLVSNELLINPVIGVRPINDLLAGHYGSGREFVPATDTEKSAGKKLAAFLSASSQVTLDALTNEEKLVLISRDSGVSVRYGFLERVTNYAKSADDLLSIFRLISPVVYPAYPKYAVSDTPMDQSKRKVLAAADIIGAN